MKHETLICREFLGCDYTTEEGLNFAQENNLLTTKFVQFVRDSVKIIEKILDIR
ncbi:MAG: hypothetical protein ACTSWY_06170 [Promethearchaeota archaeon]